MSNTVRVRSTALMPVLISEPMPKEFVDKPGLAPVLRTGVIRPGMNDVDVELWKSYSSADPKPDLLAGGHFVESPDEDLANPGDGFGFEPALAAASTEDASDGSVVKDAGPVSSSDMKPTSDAPADDSPRSNPPNAMANPATAAPAPTSAGPATVTPALAPAPAVATAKPVPAK